MDAIVNQGYRPIMSAAQIPCSEAITVYDEYGQAREVDITGERPLALIVDRREIVTLMTLGGKPELLAIGYLLNQGLINSVEELVSVETDWGKDAVAVTTRDGVADLDEKLKHRIVTSGCGQGTVFGRLMSEFEDLRVPGVKLRQSDIYELLHRVIDHNDIYKRSGSVHSCGLCRCSETLFFVEDVGRHNAADVIAGHMAMENIDGGDKIFYTTGRLTSEMVIKVSRMGIPVLVSRNGVTEMGLEFAEITGMTLIARAKGKHFLVYHGHENLIYDQMPAPRADSGRPRKLHRRAV